MKPAPLSVLHRAASSLNPQDQQCLAKFEHSHLTDNNRPIGSQFAIFIGFSEYIDLYTTRRLVEILESVHFLDPDRKAVGPQPSPVWGPGNPPLSKPTNISKLVPHFSYNHSYYVTFGNYHSIISSLKLVKERYFCLEDESMTSWTSCDTALRKKISSRLPVKHGDALQLPGKVDNPRPHNFEKKMTDIYLYHIHFRNHRSFYDFARISLQWTKGKKKN